MFSRGRTLHDEEGPFLAAKARLMSCFFDNPKRTPRWEHGTERYREGRRLHPPGRFNLLNDTSLCAPLTFRGQGSWCTVVVLVVEVRAARQPDLKTVK